MPVHIYGHPCNGSIKNSKKPITVIEDVAEFMVQFTKIKIWFDR